MIKVVEVLNNMGMGGVESLIKDYVAYIDKEEFEISVVVGSSEQGTPNEEALRRLGIKTVYVGNELRQDIPKWNVIGKILRKRKRHHLFYEAIKREKPDVIHGHQHVNSYLYDYARRNPGKSKLFYTVHSDPNHIFRKKTEKSITSKLVSHYGLRLIALHEEAAKELCDMFGVHDVFVINNGIDIERFQNAKGDRKAIGIPDDAVVIGNVGRMNWVKNQSFLIDIFEIYKRREPKAFLLIIGTGEKKRELLEKLEQKGLEECSLILSNRGDIPELLKVMDYFVFPSLHEGFPLTVLEAQASGLKCVISDKISEVVYASDRISVVSTEKSPETWANAIGTDQYVVKGKYSLEQYGVRNMVRTVENIYRM